MDWKMFHKLHRLYNVLEWMLPEKKKKVEIKSVLLQENVYVFCPIGQFCPLFLLHKTALYCMWYFRNIREGFHKNIMSLNLSV